MVLSITSSCLIINTTDSNDFKTDFPFQDYFFSNVTMNTFLKRILIKIEFVKNILLDSINSNNIVIIFATSVAIFTILIVLQIQLFLRFRQQKVHFFKIFLTLNDESILQ